VKQYIAIVASENGKVIKYIDFDVEADASQHVATHGGFVVSDPGGPVDYWEVSGENVTYNSAAQASDEAIQQAENEIIRLESKITNRRLREASADTAAGSEAGRIWLKDQDALIAVQRGVLNGN